MIIYNVYHDNLYYANEIYKYTMCGSCELARMAGSAMKRPNKKK